MGSAVDVVDVPAPPDWQAARTTAQPRATAIDLVCTRTIGAYDGGWLARQAARGQRGDRYTRSSWKGPTVTVGLPVYNGERYLAEAIESVLSQTYEDLELVISDNASTDATESICKAYAERDPRVRYERNSANVGAARNYNITLERAKGRYFKWLAHDDVCEPRFIEVCVEALDSDPEVVLAYPTPVDIDENGAWLGEMDAGLEFDRPTAVERFAKAMGHVHGCLPVFGLTRTDILRLTEQHGNYPSADRVLLAELTLWGKLTEIPEKLYLHREHPERFVYTYTTAKERAEWFDPSRKGATFYTFSRELRGYVEAIHRAPISITERWGAYRVLARWVWRNKRNMAGEVKAGVLARLRPAA